MSEKVTPLKAIKNYCRKCVGGGIRAVKKCHNNDCALFLYRSGNDPGRQGAGNKTPYSKILKFG